MRSFEVVPDLSRLAASGVTMTQLREAIEANNRNDGAGRISDGDEALLVRGEGSIRTLDDLRAIVVTMQDAAPVRLGDVAEVRIGTVTRYGVVTQGRQGRSGAGPGAWPARRRTRKRSSRVSRKSWASCSRPCRRASRSRSSTTAPADRRPSAPSRSALLEATVLVVVLLLLFLGNLRAAIVVALVLPLAALTTFLLMRVFGLSANLMSLGGLAIAVGMLVDAAVVVVENIVEHLAPPHGGRASCRGCISIYRAVREVAVPVPPGI